LRPVKGEVDEKQALDATHATILDEHDDDEGIAGEREEENRRVETDERYRGRLVDGEHVRQVVFDQPGRLVGWLTVNMFAR